MYGYVLIQLVTLHTVFTYIRFSFSSFGNVDASLVKPLVAFITLYVRNVFLVSCFKCK